MKIKSVVYPAYFTAYHFAALEEWLARNADCSDCEYLLLYINKPCVVVGKNQSLWKEVNAGYLNHEGNVVVRRISGGGTVYHDEGNLNFCVIASFEDGKVNNYQLLHTPVVKALRAVGFPVEWSKRNDLLLGDKKISGSAQFTNRKNIASHGTILMNANLANLRAALKPNDFEVESKGVSSVPSSVMNLCEVDAAIATADELYRYLEETIASGTFVLNEHELEEIEQLVHEKYTTAEWILGRSPDTNIYKNGKIFISHGKMERLEVKGLPDGAEEALTGCFYSVPFVLERLTKQAFSKEEIDAMIALLF
jgi:lipoate-protein ligase A